MTTSFRVLACAATTALLGSVPAAAAPLASGTTRLIDRPTNGQPLPSDMNGYSIGGPGRGLSSDGRFAVFESDGDAFVLATVGSLRGRGVYVRDRLNNTVENVCVTSGGVPANSGCGNASISPNGRFVSFTTNASNLGTGSFQSAVYVHDRQTHTTTLMSRATGLAGAIDSGYPSNAVVADNGTVAFVTSTALDPVVDAGNTRNDVYTRTLAGVTKLVSQTAGTVGNGGSFTPDISGDGTVVAFVSTATNFSGADPNTRSDVYTAPSGGGAVTLQSRAGAAGAVGDQASGSPSISQDGGELAFETDATNLVAGDGNGTTDVILRVANANTPISIADGTSNTFLPFGGESPIVNATGSAVAFQAPQGSAPSADYFVTVRRPATNATTIASRRPGVGGAPVRASVSGLSADGNIAMFGTSLLDGGAEEQMWVRVLDTASNDRLSRPGAADLPPQAGYSSVGGTSADGRFTVFTSTSIGLGPSEDATSHTYLRDERSGTTTQLDRIGGPGGPASSVSTESPRISDDGSVVVFQGYGSGLAAGDEVGSSHLYAWHRATGQITVVSRAPDGTPVAIAPETGGDVSGDGKRVAFVTAENFLPGDANAVRDLFIRDLTSGAVFLASLSTGGTPATLDARDPRLDADGSTVAFSTKSPLDPAADTNAKFDAYVRDLAAARTMLVSRKDGADTAAGNDDAFASSLSADGNRIVFHTGSSDLGDGDTSAVDDVHLRDLATNRTLWISRSHNGAQNDRQSYYGSISGDGQRVVFESWSSTIISPAQPDAPALYIRDLSVAAATQVLAPPTDPTMQIYMPELSANGQCVAFQTPDPSVVSGGYASVDYQHVYLKAIGDQCLLDDPPTLAPTPVAAAKDTTVPVLSALKVSRKTFARQGKKKGTVLSFTASERALVRLELAPLTTGKRKGKRCLKPAKVKGKAKACLIEGTPRLVLTQTVDAGARTIKFVGTIKGKKVKAGRYRLILTATDNAGNATAKRLTVDVVIR